MSKRGRPKKKDKSFAKVFQWLAVNLGFPFFSVLVAIFTLSILRKDFTYVDLAGGSELFFVAFVAFASTTLELALSDARNSPGLKVVLIFMSFLTFLAAVLFGIIYAFSAIEGLDYDKKLAAYVAIGANVTAFVFVCTPVQSYITKNKA